MRALPLTFAALLAASAAAQPALVCPAPQAGRPCEAFHYHVQLYSPDKRQFVSTNATSRFATQASCDRAREQAIAANAKVAEYFRSAHKQQYEPDRFGPCHCDLTSDRSAATFVDAAQRELQLRATEEVRLRVRERLLDHKVPSDSELLRALYAEPPVTAMLGAPKLVPLPQAAPAAVATSPDDLHPTKTIDTSRPAVVALDLPLAEPGGVAAPVAPEVTVAAEPDAPQPVAPQAAPQVEETVPTEEELLSAQETAERFISYETQRIDNILKAAGAIGDETVKAKIYESCMQRIQLLSNLGLLIEGSGMRSRLTTAARDAETEPERLALMAQLFGDDVKTHWAPRDASEVIFEVGGDIAAAPERALRDTTGRFSMQQKKRALYVVLAQTQPTEDQRLWLSTVVEGFLR